MNSSTRVEIECLERDGGIISLDLEVLLDVVQSFPLHSLN